MDIEYAEIEHLESLENHFPIHKHCFSENDTWGSLPNSPKLLTIAGIDSSLDELLSKLHKPLNQAEPKQSSPVQKKRGRKPIRPNDPIKKKTEEKDKYWLRVFRAYMKNKYPEISNTLSIEEQSFWVDHLSPKGVPDKGNIFSSYGKKYKNHLFGQPSFVYYFQEWFCQHGEIELSRKCSKGSDLWFVFFDYAIKELINFVPVGCYSANSFDSPRSPASPIELDEECSEPVEFSMVSDENIDFFLNQI